MELLLQPSSSILQALLSQFTDKLEQDTREPIFTFQFPANLIALLGKANIENDPSSSTTVYYGLLGPKLLFWWQLILLVAIQSINAVAVACFIYKFIIKQRGTTTAFLSGYAIVLPYVLWMPFKLCRALELQNMAQMLTLAVSTALVFFRCFEAMYGTSPAKVEQDLLSYCLYYCALVQLRFDSETGKPIKVTKEEMQTKVLQFAPNFFLMGVLNSIFHCFTYLPFPTSILTDQTAESWADLFHWGHLCNNLALAFLTYFGLDTGSLLIGCSINLISGCSTISMNDEPLTKSTSVSDFWGRRWNQLVHGVLKRGIFKPVRNYFPKSIATIVTFVFSGLFHEYVILVTALKNESLSSQGTNTHYDPRYGKHMAFFAWNGFMMIVEYFLADNFILLWIGNKLPQPIKTMIILMLVIPISHWFTHEYVNSGFYDDLSIGYPKIVRL
mmetsp:Transcript_29691/g.45530  ORF Transcript_29691/g.45530 Transcript_29691/m.45530 type:complete len:443 (-) Transcript_29691:89-1417(-)